MNTTQSLQVGDTVKVSAKAKGVWHVVRVAVFDGEPYAQLARKPHVPGTAYPKTGFSKSSTLVKL